MLGIRVKGLACGDVDGLAVLRMLASGRGLLSFEIYISREPAWVNARISLGIIVRSCQADKYMQSPHTHITGRQTDSQAGRQASRQAGRQAERQTDRQTERQTDRQTNRQTDRQTDRRAGQTGRTGQAGQTGQT